MNSCGLTYLYRIEERVVAGQGYVAESQRGKDDEQANSVLTNKSMRDILQVFNFESSMNNYFL